MNNTLLKDKFQLVYHEGMLCLYYGINNEDKILIYVLFKNYIFKIENSGQWQHTLNIENSKICITTLLYENKNFLTEDSIITKMIIDIIMEENKDFINQFLNQER